MKTHKAIKKLLKKGFRINSLVEKIIIISSDKPIKSEEFDWLHTTFSEHYELDFMTTEQFSIRLVKKKK